MAVTIRRATASDGRRLFGAWQQMREHNASRDARIVLAPVSETEFSAGLGESLARAGSTTIIAEDSDRVVGFVSATVTAGTPDRLPERHVSIGYIFVDPGHRRGGVARLLIDAVREWAGEQDGVEHLEMPVLAADASAAEFWRAVGFTPFIERLWAPLVPPDGGV